MDDMTHSSGDYQYHTIPLYFPRDTKQIKVHEHGFEVQKVTPEQIILKYLGIEKT